VVEQSRAGHEQHLVHLLKSAIAPVVGIGDIQRRFGVAAERRIERSHQERLVRRRSQRKHVITIGPIHRDEKIKAVEVAGRSQFAGGVDEAQAVCARDLHTSRVGPASRVPAARAAGINAESVGYAAIGDHVLKDALGQRRAADVSKADEEDTDWLGRHRGGGVDRGAVRH